MFILVAEGADRQALLDTAIAAQLAMVETPLLQQVSNLAEEVSTEIAGFAINQFIVWMGIALPLIFIATWATRRSLRKGFESEEPA